MKYAPADLDRMRTAIADIISAQNHNSYRPEDRARSIEAQLLTYMANETTPEELEEHKRQAWKAYWARTESDRRAAAAAAAARSARAGKAFVAVDYDQKKRWWHL